MYRLINLLLFIAVICLAVAHWRYAPAPQDRILQWHPPSAVIQEPVRTDRDQKPQLSAIRAKNIFSPRRGRDAEKTMNTPEKRRTVPKFELVGICTIGEQSGAIIEAPDIGIQGKNTRKRSYYALGDELPAGYSLEKINEESVILKRSQEFLELKITRSRFSRDAKRMKKDKERQPIPPRVNPPLIHNKLRTAQPGVSVP